MSGILFILLALPIWLIPLRVASRYGMIKWFSPLHLLAFYAFMGTFLKSIGMLILPGEAFMYRFIYSDSSLYLGYIYTLGFTVCICLGYVLAIRERAPQDGPSLARLSMARIGRPKLLLLLGGLAALVTVSTLVTGRFEDPSEATLSLDTLHTMNQTKIQRIEGVEGYGASNAAIKVFGKLAWVALAVFFALLFIRQRKTYLYGFVIIAAIVLISTLVKGKRLELLSIAMCLTSIYFILGGRIRWKFVLYGLCGAGAILAIFALLTVLRSTKGDLSEAAFDPMVMVGQILLSTYFFDFGMSAIIIDRFDTDLILRGQSYVNWIIGFVPRDIWPDKPAISLGPFVKQEVLGMAGTIGGINPTGPGEAFLNFGWGGIFVGLGLGIIFRRFEAFFLSGKGLLKRYGLVIYPVIGMPFITGCLQSTFGGVVVSTLTVLVLSMGVLHLTKRRSSPRSLRSSPHAKYLSPTA